MSSGPADRAIVRDPDDDHVLACALAASADLIVTDDVDLLALKIYQDIPIVIAAEALGRIETEKEVDDLKQESHISTLTRYLPHEQSGSRTPLEVPRPIPPQQRS